MPDRGSLGPPGAAHSAPVGVKWGQDTQDGLRYVAAAQINSSFMGRWDRNRTCTLRFWRSRRCVPDGPVRSQYAEYPCASMRVPSHTVPLRSIALLPFLLPPAPRCIRMAPIRIAMNVSRPTYDKGHDHVAVTCRRYPPYSGTSSLTAAWGRLLQVGREDSTPSGLGVRLGVPAMELTLGQPVA
jgi:hypothetical protein